MIYFHSLVSVSITWRKAAIHVPRIQFWYNTISFVIHLYGNSSLIFFLFHLSVLTHYYFIPFFLQQFQQCKGRQPHAVPRIQLRQKNTTQQIIIRAHVLEMFPKYWKERRFVQKVDILRHCVCILRRFRVIRAFAMHVVMLLLYL